MTNNPKLFINILSDFDMPLFLHYSSFCKNYFQIFFFFTIFPFFTNIQQQQLHSCTYRCNNRWGEVIVLRKVSWIAMGLESMFTQLTSKSLSLLAEIKYSCWEGICSINFIKKCLCYSFTSLQYQHFYFLTISDDRKGANIWSWSPRKCLKVWVFFLANLER